MSTKAAVVCFVARNTADLVAFDPPPPGPRQVRLKAHFTLVSSGTELAYFSGIHHEVQSGLVRYPMGTRGGYSFCGEVIQCGEGVTRLREGQLVVAQRGHASETVVDESQALPVPDGVTAPEASFAVAGSIALHGVRMAGISAGHSVAVTGLGLIGQLTAQLCLIAGARIVATDPSAARLRCALDCGVEHGLEAGNPTLAAALEGPLAGAFPQGIHHAIETSGAPAALNELLEAVSPEGGITLLGCPHEPVQLDLYTHLQKKQLRLVGAYQPRCPDEPNAFYPWSKLLNQHQILSWIHSGRLNVRRLLTLTAAPKGAQRLYEQIAGRDEVVAGGFDWTKR